MLSTRHQWFTCVHLSVTYLIRFLPDLFLSCSRPWLLTTAAEGDLRPAPVSWSRGAFLFSLISCSVAQRATSSARSALVAHSRRHTGRTRDRVVPTLYPNHPAGCSRAAATTARLAACLPSVAPAT